MIRRYLRFELTLWRSLAQWATRRTDRATPGTDAYTYHRPALPLLLTFVALSAIEIPAVAIIIQLRWLADLLLILGVYGLLLCLGIVASLVVRPYLISENGVLLRQGAKDDLWLSWDDIHAVRLTTRRDWQAGYGYGVETLDNRAGYVVSGETHIALLLEHPVTVKGTQVTEIHLAADQPQALADRIAAGPRP